MGSRRRTTDGSVSRSFVERDGASFVLDGEPFVPVGGNHPQLRKQSTEEQLAWLEQWLSRVPELDVLRASAWGTGSHPDRTDRPLQPVPGKHSEAAFERLDRLVALCAEHDIRLILALNNYWDWQGGIPQYVDWSDAATERADFYEDEQCQEWYRDHIETVLTRENSITGVEYRDDPTIMLWELANEPEPDGCEEAFLEWIRTSTEFIKSVDDNHLVSTGMGMDTSTALSSRAHEFDAVDAYSYHNWVDEQHVDIGPRGGIELLQAHAETAHEVLEKPIYVGEFGWPVDRDGGERDYSGQLRTRNDVFEQWIRTMSAADVDGALIWDLRHEAEYPLDWNPFAVFPDDAGTAELLGEAVARLGPRSRAEPSVRTD